MKLLAMVLGLSSNVTVELDSPGSAEELERGSAKEMRLVCTVEGSDDVQVKWFWNGQKLKKSGTGGSVDSRYTSKRKNLTLLNPSFNDNGVYSCEAENSAGIVRSVVNFVLSIPGPTVPRLIAPPIDEIAKLGSDVRFQCRFDNAKRIAWRKAETGTTEEFGTTGRQEIIHQSF